MAEQPSHGDGEEAADPLSVLAEIEANWQTEADRLLIDQSTLRGSDRDQRIDREVADTRIPDAVSMTTPTGGEGLTEVLYPRESLTGASADDMEELAEASRDTLMAERGHDEVRTAEARARLEDVQARITEAEARAPRPRGAHAGQPLEEDADTPHRPGRHERTEPAPLVPAADPHQNSLIEAMPAGRSGEEGWAYVGKYRPAANEVLVQALSDAEYEAQLLAKPDLGTDYTPDGYADVMAVAALPYMKRAEAAEARGYTRRAAIYREEARSVAYGIAVGMYWEVPAGMDVRSGPLLVRTRGSKTPTNHLAHRSIRQKNGVSIRALLRRS